MTVDPPSSLTLDGTATSIGGSAGKAPSLQRELLANLALLVAAALALAMATALVAQALRPAYAFILLMALVAADAGIVFAFGHYLLRRLVLARLAALRAAAEELAAGNLQRRVPPAETREFTELADCFNRMTDRLLDAQGQLVRSEKLATVGRLAAGVAHEVGNPLAALGTYLEVLRRRGTDAEVLAAAAHELGRIDQIIRGLLDYARPSEDRLARVDLTTIIRSALELLERQGVLKGVAFRLELEQEALAVPGRAHALEQVMVNLLLNAVDAAPQGPVAIGAMRWRFAERPELARRRDDDPGALGASGRRQLGGAARRRPWRPEVTVGARGVLVYVADAGPGVPPGERERVFEPFYTTKPPGRGTGLGLAIVQRTVDELGGVVWVEEAREGGAVFKVFLPEAADA
jgi:two-component system NtrC family sensor kinase